MKAIPFKVITNFLLAGAILLMSNACDVQSGKSNQEQFYYEAVEVDDMVALEQVADYNTEEYDRIYENSFKTVVQNPLSTFSIDVDNAAYSNLRRFLNHNQLPPKDAVRIEEMINYFNYDYPQPEGQHPFSFTNEVAPCPWNSAHKLVHIGIQGKSLDYENLKSSNLVFLIDASGSMGSSNKLPLLKKSLKLLLNELNDNDRVAIVAYAGSAGLVLPSTKASKKATILNALDRIESGGSTAGGEGIRLAYKIAKENFMGNGNNRVVLATDGDFNIGVSSTSELVRLIEDKCKDDIYLTICGFGMGNYKDGRMEQISNAGNGNYFYIDNIKEAQKVFSKEMRANMFTIAKDVKIQIEFNPNQVKGYRLIGYENRVMNDEDFNDDEKDAGELGAGHTVTALYEIIPHNSEEQIKTHDDLKYQKTTATSDSKSNEMLTIKFRYKQPKADESILISHTISDGELALKDASNNFKFSAAVTGFGLLLRDSKYKGNTTYNMIKSLAKQGLGDDVNGYRQEFVNLVETASLLSEKY